MRRLFSAICALGAVTFAFSANAADLSAGPPLKAPMAVPVGYDWTGLYIGGQLGLVRSVPSVLDQNYFDGGNTTTFPQNGFEGGGQIGYNWQFGNLVTGGEADIAGASASKSFDGYYATNSSKVDAFGTLRGRAGIAVDRTLFYATGGLAWIDGKISYTDIGTPSINASSESSSWGWVAGFGIEQAIMQNWTVRFQALYMAFDRGTTPLSNTTCTTNFGPRVPCEFNFTQDLWTLQLGVNYKFW